MEKFVPAFNYTFLTPFYDALSNLIGFGDKQKLKIVKLLDLKNNERLLDIGCGTGSLLRIAKTIYPNNQMAGLDIDKEILKIANKKFEKLAWILNL